MSKEEEFKQLNKGESKEETSIPEKEVDKEKENYSPENNKELIEDKLREDLDKLETRPKSLKNEIEEEKKQIKNLKTSGKLSRLLSLAKTKGAHYAVDIVKQMNDPYMLDALHDLLVQEGLSDDIE